MARIGWYLLFLLAYMVYSIAVKYGSDEQKRQLTARKGSTFVGTQFGIIGGLIPIVLIPWILTGFFSKRFLFAVLIAFELSAILISLSFLLSSVTRREITLRFTMWGAELALRHPLIVKNALNVLGLAVLVVYVAAISYIYR